MSASLRDADLRVSTKRNILHWKRQPNADGVKGLEKHFRNMTRVNKYLKAGGAITIAVDGALTVDTIIDACQADERRCERTAMVEGGGFGGRTLGSSFGAGLGYGVCSIVFTPVSGGSSFFWCALVVGAAGAYAGGEVGNLAGKAGGELLYETKSSLIP